MRKPFKHGKYINKKITLRSATEQFIYMFLDFVDSICLSLLIHHVEVEYSRLVDTVVVLLELCLVVGLSSDRFIVEEFTRLKLYSSFKLN